MRSKKAQLKTYKKRSVGFDHENGEKRETKLWFNGSLCHLRQKNKKKQKKGQTTTKTRESEGKMEEQTENIWN